MTLNARLVASIAAMAVTFSFPVASRAQAPAAPADHSAHQHGAPAAQSAQVAPAPAATAPAAATAQAASPAKPSIKELTLAMNTAVGPAKIEAMSALLNAMLAEQEACKAKMADMMKKHEAK